MNSLVRYDQSSLLLHCIVLVYSTWASYTWVVHPSIVPRGTASSVQSMVVNIGNNQHQHVHVTGMCDGWSNRIDSEPNRFIFHDFQVASLRYANHQPASKANVQVPI